MSQKGAPFLADAVLNSAEEDLLVHKEASTPKLFLIIIC